MNTCTQSQLQKLEVRHIDPCCSSQQCNYKRTSPYEACEWDDRISLCACAFLHECVRMCLPLFRARTAFALYMRFCWTATESVCPCALCVRGPAIPPHMRRHKGRHTVCPQVHILYISTLHTVHAPFCSLVCINLSVAVRSDPRMLSGCQVLLPFTLVCTPTHSSLLGSSFHRRPAFFNAFLFAVFSLSVNRLPIKW